MGFVAAASTLEEQANVAYVGKHGDDANDGLHPDRACLTIQGGITAIENFLDPASPTDSDQWVIRVVDAGEYDETLVLADNMHLDARYARITGNVTLGDDTVAIVRELKSEGTGDGIVAAPGLSTNWNHIEVGRISLAGNNALGLVTGGSGMTTFNVGHIQEESGATTKGILAAGNACGFVGRVEADTAIEVSSGKTLRLVAGDIVGTLVETGTLELLEADEINVSAVNTDDLNVTGTSPNIILTNTTETDADQGRISAISFLGYTAAAELHTLGSFNVRHDGGSADQKGKLVLAVNDGDDGLVPSVEMALLASGDLEVPAKVDGRDLIIDARHLERCYYSKTSAMTLTNSLADVTWDVENREGANFTHDTVTDADEITFDFDGDVEVRAVFAVDNASGTAPARADAQVQAQVDTGGGFAALSGDEGITDAQVSCQKVGTVTAGPAVLVLDFYLTVSDGDKLRFQAQESRGDANSTLNIRTQGTQLRIVRVPPE